MKIEDLYEIRQRSLRRLIDDKYSKNSAEFCRAHGFDENRVRHLLNGVRNFGEKSARKMEEACGLPDFYFDIDGGDGVAVSIIASINLLDERDKKEIVRHLQLLKRDNSDRTASGE